MTRRRTALWLALALACAAAAIAWPASQPPAATPAVATSTLPGSALLATRAAVSRTRLERALTGSVRNARGAAVARASVCVEPRPERDGEPPRYDGYTSPGAATGVCTSTGANGEFAFSFLRPGSYHVQAMEAAFGIAGTSVTLEDARPAHVELTLQEGAALVGRVRDVQGGPVMEAKIFAMQPIEGAGAQLGTARAVSDEAGAFRARVRPGDVVLRVTAQGYADAFVRAHAPASDLDIALVPAARLIGQVVNAADGAPVAGAQVTAARSLPEAVMREGHAQSDNQGRFAIEGLLDGSYEVVAEAPGFRSASSEHVELAVAARDEVRVRVQRTVALSGVVITSPGRTPCPGAEVTISGTHSERPFGAHAISDAAGRIRFDDVPPSTYELAVSWRGRYTSLPQLTVAHSRDDLSIEVNEGLTLSGRVIDSLRAPVANEGVTATPQQGGESVMARSDERGRFELRGLAPGSYRIAATSTPSKSLVVEVTQQSAAQEIVLERGAMAALEVKLLHTDGTELAGTWQVYARSERILPAERSGKAYAFRSLPAGVHRIVAYDGVNAPVEDTVELKDGERRELTLLLPRHTGVLRGRVVGEDGMPVADAWVSVHAGNSGALASARSVLTAADGTFEFDGIAALGRYDVEAHAAAQGAGRLSGVEPGRDALIAMRASTSD